MGTMVVTTILTFFVVRYRWGYPLLACVLPTAFFLTIDLTFFAANATKVADGGWFPLVVAACIFTLMTTWKRGRAALGASLAEAAMPLEASSPVGATSLARSPFDDLLLLVNDF